MLIKQIIRCKALSAKSANFYLQIKNINMISKIIFEIRFKLFRFFLIRIKVLIILNLIWIDMINIFIIKIKIFCNMIWLSRIKWLWSIFSNIFISILIMMKVSFSLKARIDWLKFWHSCCINDNYQKLLCSWYFWLIILKYWILKYRIWLLFFIFSVIIIFL